MSNIAIILAGGNKETGKQGIPIQFVSIYDKPIIMYTLENFQRHPQIDAIEVVCLDGWDDALKAFAMQFNISKLKWVTCGGINVQESIRNGVFNLMDYAKDEDIVVIHDGSRPMMDGDVLTDVIRVALLKGNAIAATRYNEQLFYIDSNAHDRTSNYIDRDTIRNVTTPQAYRYKDLYCSYKTAFDKQIGIENSDYTDTMMVKLGNTLYFATGSDQNFKIVSARDIELFKELLHDQDSMWLK